eukprot:gene31554-6740_t
MSIAPGMIKPCDNQVGGHMSKDQAPDMFTDEQGRFYKPYQKGLRAEHEQPFYQTFCPPEGSDCKKVYGQIKGLRAEREQAFYQTLCPPEGSDRKYRPALPIPEDEQPAMMESQEGEFPEPEDVKGLKPYIAEYCECRQYVFLWDEQPAMMESQEGESPEPEDVKGLKPYIAEYFGVAEHDGRKFIVLEDICKQYEKPCVIDCKSH